MDRLKQIVDRKEEKIEKEIAELAEEQMELQAIMDAKARSQSEHQQPQDFSVEDPEALPVPAAIYHNGPLHSGKRTSCKYTLRVFYYAIFNFCSILFVHRKHPREISISRKELCS